MKNAAFAAPALPTRCPSSRRAACRRRAPRSVTGVTDAEAVATLRALSAGTSRGKTAGAAVRGEVEAVVQQLEACNPTPGAFGCARGLELVDGEWELLFSMNEEDRAGKLQEQSIAAADKDRGRVTQTLEVAKGRVQNAATFSVLGVGAEVSVDASFEIADEDTVEVYFEWAKFKLGVFPEISVPLSMGKKKPGGSVRTTYLSERCRLGRGNKGTLFVLVRGEGEAES